jgi:hypothetical protein
MTDREQFKFGFFLKCAEHGYNAEQAIKIAEQMVHQKSAGLETPMLVALAGGIGAGLLGGRMIGKQLVKMKYPYSSDSEVRAQEIYRAYRDARLRAENRKILKNMDTDEDINDKPKPLRKPYS